MTMTPTPPPEETDALRPHAYDGIVEYDKRLPNWWLYTLYITIAFWLGYWGYYEWFRVGPTGAQRVEVQLARIEAQKLASTTTLDDATLWQMSRNPTFVEAGKAAFNSNCVACHLASLRGKAENPTAIGVDLTDQVWIHGGRPTEVMTTITNGVLVKGMPTWGPILGQKKISEVVAYVFSLHKEGEPITVDPTAAPVAAKP
jgi:cytochrome c oxidase cbb3-type subunit 3